MQRTPSIHRPVNTRRDEAAWHRRIGPAALPVYTRLGTFWVTPREWRIAVKTMSGQRFTLRAMAEALGYSLHGLANALATMSELGLFRVIRRRGCHGFTRLVWARDVSARPPAGSNVPTTSTVETSLPGGGEISQRTVVGTFDPPRLLC